ncbi:MAG: hypothetical protein SFU25_00525 [Candidatus Caenarcaniphilales bacterium]|nr:hypothetical protein [Candidatus Caenarcaniphilales bacterium]
MIRIYNSPHSFIDSVVHERTTQNPLKTVQPQNQDSQSALLNLQLGFYQSNEQIRFNTNRLNALKDVHRLLMSNNEVDRLALIIFIEPKVNEFSMQKEDLITLKNSLPDVTSYEQRQLLEEKIEVSVANWLAFKAVVSQLSSKSKEEVLEALLKQIANCSSALKSHQYTLRTIQTRISQITGDPLIAPKIESYKVSKCLTMNCYWNRLIYKIKKVLKEIGIITPLNHLNFPST